MAGSRQSELKLRTLLSTAAIALAPALIGAGSVLLTPTAALAANECAPVGVAPSANLSVADSYTCAAGAYSGGITYSSDGDLTVTSGGAVNVNTTGGNLTGANADAVTLNTTAGLVTGTAGPVIDVTSNSGPISISTAGVTGTNVNVTNGILATSASGAITISTNGAVNVTAGFGTPQQQAAISATTSGAINITTAGGNVTGRLYGIQAQGTGGGAIVINADSAVNVNNAAGLAAIDATNATGALTVNIGSVPDTTGVINGQTGTAIRLGSSGPVAINISSGRTVSTTAASTAGTIVINSGGAFSLNNSGAITGRLVSGGVTGTSTFTNAGTWSTGGVNSFSAGASTLANSGTITLDGDTSFTGLETLTNTGTMTVSGSSEMLALTTLNNSGTIALGSGRIATAEGAQFNGTGDSLVTTTVNYAGGGQADCTAATVAGCLYMPGATVSGVTQLRVAANGEVKSQFSATPIVLVDISGGAGTAGAFVLDPGSSNYVIEPGVGPAIATTGLFAYTLDYDEETQQYALLSVPRAGVYEYAPLISQVLTTWHTGAEAVVGRAGDLGSSRESGLWVRLIGDQTERDFTQTFDVGARTLEFSGSYSQDTGAVLMGIDFGSDDVGLDGVLLGVHGGLVRASTELDGSTAADDIDGVILGVHGGMTTGGLTVDGAVSANLLNFVHTDLALGDSSNSAISIGARAEAGWRFPLGEVFFVQPLVTGAYVRSEIKDLTPGNYTVSYSDAESMRAAFGLRAGGAMETGAGSLGFWLTGRAWQEFSDEANLSVQMDSADDFTLTDDLSGNFEEVSAGLTLDVGEALSLFMSAGMISGDNAENLNGSAGVAWRW